jgi:hypothetical protein
MATVASPAAFAVVDPAGVASTTASIFAPGAAPRTITVWASATPADTVRTTVTTTRRHHAITLFVRSSEGILTIILQKGRQPTSERHEARATRDGADARDGGQFQTERSGRVSSDPPAPGGRQKASTLPIAALGGCRAKPLTRQIFRTRDRRDSFERPENSVPTANRGDHHRENRAATRPFMRKHA